MKKRMIALALVLLLLGGAVQTYAISSVCQPLSLRSGALDKLFDKLNQVFRDTFSTEDQTEATTPATNQPSDQTKPAETTGPVKLNVKTESLE